MIRLHIILCFCLLTSCSNKRSRCFNSKIEFEILNLKNEQHLIFGDKNDKDSIYVYDQNCKLLKIVYYNHSSNFKFNEYLKNDYDLEFINFNNNLYVDNNKKIIQETYTITGKKFLNRLWKFDSNLELDTLNSNFFEYEILDTLKKNEYYIGKFNFYFNEDISKKIIEDYQYIIVGNNINKSFKNISKVNVDTFVANENKFIYKFENEGLHSLNIKILNKIVYLEKDNKNDSLFIVEENRYHYLSKEIFVK